MADSNKRDLTEGPVWKALTAMSAPMSFGIFSVIAVGLADAYFLGQVSGAAWAAVGFIYPVITALTSLAIGLSAGANATLSQRIGARKSDDDVQRLGLHAIGLGVAWGLISLAGPVWAQGARDLVAALPGHLQPFVEEYTGIDPQWRAAPAD